ncbi:cathepsin L-like thiolproteinase, putative, partial [Eimeria tenella]
QPAPPSSASPAAAAAAAAAAGELPESVDWREKGCVTAAKDQGPCGSCWAFSSTGALEGALCAAGGPPVVPLSEQMLLDCSGPFGTSGCSGGLMDAAFQFAAAAGLCAAAEYFPYEARARPCRSGFRDLPPRDPGALRGALAGAPVSVAVQGDQLGFQFYKSGIFDGSCGEELNHGVLLVGFGKKTQNHKDRKFFILKNSWGEGWGQRGFMLLDGDKGGA